MSSAGNLCKQFGSKSGPTFCRTWFRSKLFDTLRLFRKGWFEKQKNQQTTKSMQNYTAWKKFESSTVITYSWHLTKWKNQLKFVHASGCLFCFCFNLYKPSVLLMGHRQTAQNQTRRRRSRRLVRFSTVCSQKVLLDMEYKWKYHTTSHKRKWTGPIDKNGKFHSA